MSIPHPTVTITFDGGTPCNVPRLGYGIGYGSYRIDKRPIVRLDHGKPMSANSAEIHTLIAAVWDVSATIGKERHLIIRGDSQIALKWANGVDRFGSPARLTKGSSPEFKAAVTLLREALTGFSVETVWHPRKMSVALFGH